MPNSTYCHERTDQITKVENPFEEILQMAANEMCQEISADIAIRQGIKADITLVKQKIQ